MFILPWEVFRISNVYTVFIFVSFHKLWAYSGNLACQQKRYNGNRHMGDVRIELGKSTFQSRDLRDSNFGTGLLARGRQNPISQ